MLQLTTVSLDDAQRLIRLGIAKAEEIGSPSNIAVVDAGGNLVAHVRMDGAQIGSIDHSINKAFTSVACQSSTQALGDDAQPGGQFYGIANSINGRAIIFAGGVPLYHGEHIVGGVGVSGGSGEQDQTVAEAAAAAL
ncbi:heme-binding protein [Pseudomonas sp. C2L12B]|uniref:Heme-binding protein n=2 Tax=Pseudomonas typographi TaxID=2715964 RepID=A0ABR7Z3P4_9PSED|nr:heme-binding protein [Pseudomonas typographi]MBD1586589.1 heme-binding protein [Pseudomonas typographi]MBD1600090.1 heme-binding protein [Pseudomonas typographi]